MLTEILIQGSLIKATNKRVLSHKPPIGTKRNIITNFSPKSRKRLLEKFARLRRMRKVIFLTLTYPAMFPSFKVAKQHLRAFLERIRRKYPKSSGIWRMEIQERGAPHFHLMLFYVPFWDKRSVAAAWAEVIGGEYLDYSNGEEGQAPFTRIEMMRDGEHAMRYMAKYIAKTDNSTTLNAPYADSGFINLPYLHDENPCGRMWGEFNKEYMPYAHEFKVLVSWHRRNFWRFRRLNAHLYPPIEKQDIRLGFTIFVENAFKYQYRVKLALAHIVDDEKERAITKLPCVRKEKPIRTVEYDKLTKQFYNVEIQWNN